MLNSKKMLIISIVAFVLFIALVSPAVLPDVTIGVKDAIIITVFVIISDFVVRFISMQEAKELRNKILLQNHQMETIINNLPFIVCFRNVDGTILRVNKYLANMFGLDPKDMEGKSSSDFYVDPEINTKEDAEVVKNKKSISNERIVEFKGHNPTWYRLVKAPIFDSQGSVKHIIVIYHNIQEDKELQEKKETFIATLTHDLKTPTIAQIKALELLLKGSLGKLTDIQTDLILQVKKSCSYMYDLIFTILDSYLFDNGQTKINPEEFKLSELVNETTTEISNLLTEKNMHIDLISITDKTVIADRFQIKRVILNILSNAINYGYTNSIINIIISADDSNITLDITNKSKYISNDKLQDMFKKFKSKDNAKFRKTSTGLGLYLSKQIIDAHNGEIYASSREDDTCTFGFSLPTQT